MSTEHPSYPIVPFSERQAGSTADSELEHSSTARIDATVQLGGCDVASASSGETAASSPNGDKVQHDESRLTVEGGEPVQAQETPPSPRLKFVFWRHRQENAQQAAAQVMDCDVIAKEHLGLTKEQRRALENAATVYLSSTATPSQHQEALGVIEEYGLVTDLPVLNELLGSNKRFVVLDASSEDREHTLLDEVDARRGQFETAVEQGRSGREVRRHLAMAVHATARADAAREELVIKQIDELVREVEPGAKIGILLGAAHTPVFHELSRRLPSERVFVRAAEDDERAKAVFNAPNEYSRALRMRPNQKLSKADLGRVMLDDRYSMPGKSRTTDGMSDADVKTLLKEINRVERGKQMQPSLRLTARRRRLASEARYRVDTRLNRRPRDERPPSF